MRQGAHPSTRKLCETLESRIELFRQQTAEAVLEVLRGAIGQWGAPREILSDNARQFVAWRGKTKFQKVLRRQGVEHVRSAPHHPMTLGKIERFWRTIWEEFLIDALFASFADASQRLAHCIGYYNHQRPHQNNPRGQTYTFDKKSASVLSVAQKVLTYYLRYIYSLKYVANL